MARADARLQELQFLALVDRETAGGRCYHYQRQTSAPMEKRAMDRMVASLLHDGYLNDYFERLLNLHAEQHGAISAYIEIWRNKDLDTLMRGGRIDIWFSHKGRVRLSELEQQLRTGRDRDPTGLLLDQRHVDMGVAISILSASPTSPLSVAFLDMNDLRFINNTYGHQAGDRSILAFFHAVLAIFGKDCEVYRNGGDEVVVVLPETTDVMARTLLAAFVRQLGKDEVDLGVGGARVRLTASCGSASTSDPTASPKALRERADQAQYRAKDRSGERDAEGHWKRSVPRVSAHAVGESGEVIVYDPRTSYATTGPST